MIETKFKMKLKSLKRNFCILAIVLGLISPHKLFAQGIELKAALDTTTIWIGDQIRYNILVDQPQDAKVSFPLLSDSLVSKVEILSASKIDTFFVGNGRLKLQQHYLITCFDSGAYIIPPIKFGYKMGTVQDTIATPWLNLTVRTIPIKDYKKIADIKDIKQMPITFAEILPYIAIGLGIILLLVALIYIYYRWKHKKPIFGLLQKPAEPPHIIAFHSLEKLKSEKLWQQGQYKQYFTRITDILRVYIEDRFKVPALESTTAEIMNSLKNIDFIDEKTLANFKITLELSDFVKFAKAEPLPDENENSWQYAHDFVLNTYHVPMNNQESAEYADEKQV
jgi:hypothetical protein